MINSNLFGVSPNSKGQYRVNYQNRIWIAVFLNELVLTLRNSSGNVLEVFPEDIGKEYVWSNFKKQDSTI